MRKLVSSLCASLIYSLYDSVPLSAGIVTRILDWAVESYEYFYSTKACGSHFSSQFFFGTITLYGAIIILRQRSRAEDKNKLKMRGSAIDLRGYELDCKLLLAEIVANKNRLMESCFPWRKALGILSDIAKISLKKTLRVQPMSVKSCISNYLIILKTVFNILLPNS